MLGSSLILRYSPLFGFGGSFFQVMYDHFTTGKSLQLFTDEYRCFLFVEDGVRMTLALIQKALQKELSLEVPWHIGGSECLSKLDFGMELVRQLDLSQSLVIPALSSEVIKDHKRPECLNIDFTPTFTITFSPRSFKDCVSGALASNPMKSVSL